MKITEWLRDIYNFQGFLNNYHTFYNLACVPILFHIICSQITSLYFMFTLWLCIVSIRQLKQEEKPHINQHLLQEIRVFLNKVKISVLVNVSFCRSLLSQDLPSELTSLAMDKYAEIDTIINGLVHILVRMLVYNSTLMLCAIYKFANYNRKNRKLKNNKKATLSHHGKGGGGKIKVQTNFLTSY